ncbi:hypothetical protein NA56DRAFT_661623 [Hyaloscypha hepaticicola]|uniref:Uncharacterized protein n=1 Tax=Hyaloscypha hepaticicola TaxID=2082293 RepID=A0A2J6PWR1_9HELO|nr:hypothetical protein NA56DRAFT_661623 [Hyaloscypha hepaticicola]
MVATNDILNMVFGIAATVLACVAIWATRRYNNRTKEREPLVFTDQRHALEQGSDVELGLLDHTSPVNATNDSTGNETTNTLKTSSQHIAQQRNNLNEVIGDALEVFSRHLRAHN